MARIELRQVTKTLAGGSAGEAPGAAFRIEDLDLEVPDGSVIAVLGPSGCGRTPALEAEKEERYRRTAELLGVELETLLDRKPKTLSGGQQQRVAIARCITRDPRLFLLDEPFSNLDQKLREKYRVHLRMLLRKFGITTVYVTHDQVEALILADRIALMNRGRIEQVGTARELHDAPRNLFVADFLNFDPDTPALNVVEGAALSPALAPWQVGFRPDGALLGARAAGAAPESLALRGEVLDVRELPLRGLRVVAVRAAGAELWLRVDRDQALAVGQPIAIAISRYHLFDPRSGERVETRGPAPEEPAAGA